MDRNAASHKSDSDTEDQCNRNQCTEHLIDRQEIHHITQK